MISLPLGGSIPLDLFGKHEPLARQFFVLFSEKIRPVGRDRLAFCRVGAELRVQVTSPMVLAMDL